MSEQSYSGDKLPGEAWETLASEPGTVLIDVRTAAEWAFVGLPDLSGAGGSLLQVEWQSYPSMQVNPAFVETVDQAMRGSARGADTAILFLCRSGARSAAAAAAMTAAGYSRCYNIAGGFEGRRDPDGHRGTVEGWKAEGLPWVQP